jgi:hypothetical protein
MVNIINLFSNNFPCSKTIFSPASFLRILNKNPLSCDCFTYFTFKKIQAALKSAKCATPTALNGFTVTKKTFKKKKPKLYTCRKLHANAGVAGLFKTAFISTILALNELDLTEGLNANLVTQLF